MKKEWILIPAACLALVFSQVAGAQGNRGTRTPNIKPRIDIGKRIASAPSRSMRVAPSRSNVGARRGSANAPQRMGRTRGVSPSPSRSGGLGRDLGSLGGNRSGTAANYGNNALGALLGDFLNNGYGYGRGFDPYAGEKAHAKAYRDAAIANAVVNVVGILATSHQQQQQVAVYADPAPRGHIERQRMLVQEGRTEEYRVWIPEYTIPATGEVVVGHHETRRREIAPVYEEREVWVPTP